MGAPWIIKKVPVPPAVAPAAEKPKDEAPVPKKPRKKATKAPKE
jgi:hypothetical protein